MANEYIMNVEEYRDNLLISLINEHKKLKDSPLGDFHLIDFFAVERSAKLPHRPRSFLAALEYFKCKRWVAHVHEAEGTTWLLMEAEGLKQEERIRAAWFGDPSVTED